MTNLSRDHLWNKCLYYLEDELPAQQFNTWIKPSVVAGSDSGLVLLAPNRFIRDWLLRNLLTRIEELAKLFLGSVETPNIEIEIINELKEESFFEGAAQGIGVSESKKPAVAGEVLNSNQASDQRSKPNSLYSGGRFEDLPITDELNNKRRSHNSNLINSYRFENFVEGKSNQLARATDCTGCCEKTPEVLTTLCFYMEVLA